jgi:hypothetical protein
MSLFAGYASAREQATTRATIFPLDGVTQPHQQDDGQILAAQDAMSSSTTSGM